MLPTFTARQIDANNTLIVDATGNQVAICERAHADLFVHAPTLLAAAQRLLTRHFYRDGIRDEDVEVLRVAAVAAQAAYVHEVMHG